MRIKSLTRSTLDAPPRPYVQAIPLFLSSSAGVREYFSAHRDEIDAITGTHLVIALPQEVEAGNVSAIVGLFSPGTGSKRYPGLLRSDLPCLWIEDGEGGHAILQLNDTVGGAGAMIQALTDAVALGGVRGASAIKAWTLQRLSASAAEREPWKRIMLTEVPVQKSTERLIAVICGVVFVAAILALAVAIPNPTRFQEQVFRIVLSLAAAGFVSMTPGFLQVTISNWIRAGGALAVFVIVYFYNPASLIATP